jgi:hypothetical protein
MAIESYDEIGMFVRRAKHGIHFHCFLSFLYCLSVTATVKQKNADTWLISLSVVLISHWWWYEQQWACFNI